MDSSNFLKGPTIWVTALHIQRIDNTVGNVVAQALCIKVVVVTRLALVDAYHVG